MVRRWMVVIGLALVAGAGVAGQGGRGLGGPPPEVTGRWSGTWSSYDPAQGATPPKEQCAALTAEISRKGDTWTAVFEGNCGRPYTYSITMNGRLVGGAVLFTGSADLGPKDGGVYDWIGRANAKQFTGFYTSAFSTGVFSLTKVP